MFSALVVSILLKAYRLDFILPILISISRLFKDRANLLVLLFLGYEVIFVANSLVYIFGVLKILMVMAWPMCKNISRLGINIIFLNVLVMMFQFFSGGEFWNVYSAFYNYGDNVGLKDGLIGLMGNRSYAGFLSVLFVLYSVKKKKHILYVIIGVFLCVQSGNRMSLVALLVFFISQINKKLLLFLAIFLIIGVFNFNILESVGDSRSFTNRLISLDWFMSYNSQWELFFGRDFDFTRAVDSQLILIGIRHGIFGILIYYYILWRRVSFEIFLIILVFSITFPVSYNPLLLFIILGIDYELYKKNSFARYSNLL